MQTMETDSKAFDRALLALNVIWVAMLISLVIYFVVAKIIGPNIQSSMSADSLKILKMVLYLAAAGILIATRFVRKLVLAKRIQFGESASIAHNPVMASYLSACVISFAMSEAIGIFGLVLFFLGKNPNDQYILLLVSAAAMFIYRPNKEEVQRLIQE